MKQYEEVYKRLAISLRDILKQEFQTTNSLQELRLRTGQPLSIRENGEEYFITEQGERTKNIQKAWRVTKEEISDTLSFMSDYSFYAFEEEIRQGYLTLTGGCRTGLCGKTVLEHGMIQSMKHISFLNIRFAHEIIGCADLLMRIIWKEEELLSTLIVSPPMGGKTTMLRDLIRQVSNGNALHNGKTVGVIDERGELAACHMGVPQNDLGIRTDVMDGCPKPEGMTMLVRSMSPEVIAVDEIGTTKDMESMFYAMNCGCSVLATAHGKSLEELKKKPFFAEMIKRKLFKRYVFLGRKHGIGTVEKVFDEDEKIVLSSKEQK